MALTLTTTSQKYPTYAVLGFLIAKYQPVSFYLWVAAIFGQVHMMTQNDMENPTRLYNTLVTPSPKLQSISVLFNRI